MKCWRRVLNRAGSVKSACVRHDLGLAESRKDVLLGELEGCQAVYQFYLQGDVRRTRRTRKARISPQIA